MKGQSHDNTPKYGINNNLKGLVFWQKNEPNIIQHIKYGNYKQQPNKKGFVFFYKLKHRSKILMLSRLHNYLYQHHTF